MPGRKKKRKHPRPAGVFAFLLIVLAIFLFVNYFYRIGRNMPLGAKPEGSVRIATLNVYGFQALASPDATAEALLKTVVENDIDILCLQEFRSSSALNTDEFKSMFIKTFPNINIDGEQCIASKLPIINHTQKYYPDDPYSYSTDVISVSGGKEIKLISVHLQTTGLYHFQHLGRSQYASQYKSIASTLEGNARNRRIQAKVISEEIEKSDLPTVLAGDFNSMPLSLVYLMLRKGMNDSYIEKGKGKGSTFRMMKDILRIDYIFHDDNFDCLDYYTHDAFLSDHRMVIATLDSK